MHSDDIKEETISGANRILDKYQSRALSGSHEFITPYDLETIYGNFSS